MVSEARRLAAQALRVARRDYRGREAFVVAARYVRTWRPGMPGALQRQYGDAAQLLNERYRVALDRVTPVKSETLPVWASRVECVVVACSGCGQAAELYDTSLLVHYDTPDAARRDLLGESEGWTEDGPSIYCRECTARRACEAIGEHDIRTVAHANLRGLPWYCARENCPASGVIHPDGD